MTTTVKTVTRQTLTRSWRDLDPKIAVQALILVVAYAALIVLYVLGKIDSTVLVAGLGPSSVLTLLGYLKRSSHKGLVAAAEQGIQGAEALAPAIASAFPATQPVIDEAESILHAIGLNDGPALAEPATPTTPVTTGTLAVNATGGGQ